MSKRTMIIAFVAIAAALIAYMSYKHDQDNEPDDLIEDLTEEEETEEPKPEPVPDLKPKKSKTKVEPIPVTDELIQQENAENIAD